MCWTGSVGPAGRGEDRVDGCGEGGRAAGVYTHRREVLYDSLFFGAGDE